MHKFPSDFFLFLSGLPKTSVSIWKGELLFASNTIHPIRLMAALWQILADLHDSRRALDFLVKVGCNLAATSMKKKIINRSRADFNEWLIMSTLNWKLLWRFSVASSSHLFRTPSQLVRWRYSWWQGDNGSRNKTSESVCWSLGMMVRLWSAGISLENDFF